MDGRGWRNESARHSLASRGIRTRAIVNPIASPDWFDEDRYFNRKFVGSGLENIDEDVIVDFIDELILRANLFVRPDIEVKSILLTGSRVSGFYKDDSDLDIYIVLKWPDDEDNIRWMESDYSTNVNNGIDNAKWDMWMNKENVIIDDNGNKIKMDVNFGWDNPLDSEYSLPYVKIWEAP